MKIRIIIITIVMALVFTFPVLAGGDKVRGDNGDGAVNQVQVVLPWWAVP